MLADAATHFAGVTKLASSVISGDYKQQLLDALGRGEDVPDIVGIKGEDIASLLPRADRFVDLNTLGAGASKRSTCAGSGSRAARSTAGWSASRSTSGRPR